VVRIVNALAADVAALGNAGAAFLPHFPHQAVLQRFTGLDPAAEQVPVPPAIAIPGAQDDHPGLGEADAVCAAIGAEALTFRSHLVVGYGLGGARIAAVMAAAAASAIISSRHAYLVNLASL